MSTNELVLNFFFAGVVLNFVYLRLSPGDPFGHLQKSPICRRSRRAKEERLQRSCASPRASLVVVGCERAGGGGGGGAWGRRWRPGKKEATRGCRSFELAVRA
jgi:hypothetical protein